MAAAGRKIQAKIKKAASACQVTGRREKPQRTHLLEGLFRAPGAGTRTPQPQDPRCSWKSWCVLSREVRLSCSVLASRMPVLESSSLKLNCNCIDRE